jgi:hypothetical protein
LHFDEVISGANRPELARATMTSSFGYRVGVGAVEAPKGLGPLDVVVGADSA